MMVLGFSPKAFWLQSHLIFYSIVPVPWGWAAWAKFSLGQVHYWFFLKEIWTRNVLLLPHISTKWKEIWGVLVTKVNPTNQYSSKTFALAFYSCNYNFETLTRFFIGILHPNFSTCAGLGVVQKGQNSWGIKLRLQSSSNFLKIRDSAGLKKTLARPRSRGGSWE